MQVKLIPYFNNHTMPATRAEANKPVAARAARWIRSELDFDAELDKREGGFSADKTVRACERVFRAMNQDDRPNGARERSLSVGDMVFVVAEDGGGSYVECFRVDPVGFDRADMPVGLLLELLEATTDNAIADAKDAAERLGI